MKKIFAGAILFSLLYSGYALSWDNKVTHKDLSRYAAENSVLDKDKGNYLKSLGFNNGLDDSLEWDNQETQFKKMRIKEWMAEGGRLEDTPNARSLNHFHNPLKSWEQAGLDDILFIFPLPPFWLPVSGQSSVLWGQSSSNAWSWQKVREYYYLAMTSSLDADRQANFAKMFKALGHQMHLLQDKAVPYHVRNDAHPLDSVQGTNPTTKSKYFERWTKDTLFDLQKMKEFAPTPKIPEVLLSSGQPGYVPITQFFDANQYDGTNPSTSLAIGLSEYTNANFMSDDTIFTEGYSSDHKHYFPYPRKTSTNLQSYMDQQLLPETIYAEDGQTDVAFWIKKDKDGEIIEHFVKPGYFFNDVDYNAAGYNFYSKTLYLDEKCHEDYAKKLLPRAVGYSAGLLDYFFRGDISVIPDGDSVSQFAIANNGREDMTGTFSLYYDDKDNNRVLLTSWENLTVAAESQSSTVNFNAPSTPEPKEKDKYIFVFQGIMGKETGAVVGKIVKWWREEWDNELTGNHTWLTTNIELLRQNPANGEAHNDAANGKLTKENIRYAGNYTARVNQTIIRDAYENSSGGSTQYCLDESHVYCFPIDFGTEFPMPITKDTVVRVKIDEMSINENIPYQDCGPEYGGPGGYQGIILHFDNGADFAFTVPDQVPFNMKLVSYITPGVETSFNIFDAFKNAKVEFTEPVNLVSVNITQQLWILCAPSTVEHRQRMVVDYIRFQEQ